MINAILKSYEKSNVGENYLFETDVKTLSNNIQEFFKAEGYELKEGTPEKRGYIKGSMGMRVMFGGFANRYKFNVEYRLCKHFYHNYIISTLNTYFKYF